jgi:hypothetical protein
MLEKTDNEQRQKIFAALSKPTQLWLVLLGSVTRSAVSMIAKHLGMYQLCTVLPPLENATRGWVN